MTVRPKFGPNENFPNKWVGSAFTPYEPITSCTKAEKNVTLNGHPPNLKIILKQSKLKKKKTGKKSRKQSNLKKIKS